MNNTSDSKIIVALDYPNPDEARAFVDRLELGSCKLKIGKELFTRSGPQIVKDCHARGFPVFLDLKFHDIPNTVAAACRAAAELGVWMMNVHASGGMKMMRAAMSALEEFGTDRPKLIAVTVLTSMSGEDLAEIGVDSSPEQQVSRLATLTQQAGLDGVVCSAKEARILREQRGDDFLLVTPGVRPAGADVGDQKRIMTPCDAIAAGASYLVIGRPITQARDPIAALAAINAEIAGN